MEQVEQFISQLEARVDPVETGLGRTYWEFANTGSAELQPRLVELEMELHSIFSNAEDFAQLKVWRESAAAGSQLARELDLLYYAYLLSQEPEELARRRAELDAEIAGHYANSRGVYNGRQYTSNDIKDVLRDSTDEAERKGVWEASKQIGPVVSGLVLELVHLRNKSAQELGFRDYYAMRQIAQEVDEAELFELLDKLEQLTREPFAALKARLDARLAQRFGLSGVDALRPWHYEDPFFQEAPRINDLQMDPFFKDKNLETLTLDTFERVQLDISQSLAQSDLYERPNKDQHAFCLTFGRHPETVHCLCNCRSNADWAGTMLHEFGHAAYDQYLDNEQAFFLRTVAHINSTEAIAMLFGRLTHNPAWLEDILGLDRGEAEELSAKAHEQLSFQMLVFTRWMMVMTHFERAMYADPQQDLNRLWWDLVERFQMLKRPEGRDMPDWASKSHLAQSPVYYHNYMLGEMTASQMQYYIEHKLGSEPLIRQPKVGEWLRSGLFEQGALRPWNESLEHLTGEKLNPEYFVNEFVRQTATAG